MAKILKHYEKNVRRNLKQAAENDPRVIVKLTKEVSALIKHRSPAHGLKIPKGVRDALAIEIILQLSGRNS